MATIPTRPETAEYVTAVSDITQVLTEAWRVIASEPANSMQEFYQSFAKLNKFQDRFQVTLEVFVGDFLPSSKSLYMRFACPSSPARVTLEDFMKGLPLVPTTSLLDNDKIVPQCSICLAPFTDKMAQAPLANNDGENQPRSTELPAETADSTDIPVRLPCRHIPVTLPCRHIFGRECIHSWLRSFKDKDPPTCPLCRTVLEFNWNPLTTGGEFYVERIKVLCPEIMIPDLESRAWKDQLFQAVQAVRELM